MLSGDEALAFKPGQYVDITIPGTEDVRSFSMANLPGTGQLEFMIKIYPDGQFSSLLAEERLKPGDEVQVTGPYGVFTLGRNPSARCCSSAAARAWRRSWRCCGRWPRRAPSARPSTTTARAGRAISSTSRNWPSSSGGCPTSGSCPRSPHCEDDADWDGERGLITDVVSRLEEELGEVDAYLCGPPPMVDAAIAMLDQGGVPESRVYFDKFTTTAP